MKTAGNALNVVFVDDDDESLTRWRTTFKRGAPSTGLELKESNRNTIKKAVLALEKARLEARQTTKVDLTKEADLFNEADLVLVDYDLIELEGRTALTGEDIAYLLRCFTSCGFIVLLNPPDLGTNSFDLRLRRSLDSWADLALGSDQLDNRWLWADTPTGFSPWSWPCLADAVVRRKHQIQQVRNASEESVLDVLGIPDAARVAMHRTMADVVSSRTTGSGTAQSKAKPYTVHQFVLNPGYGVRRKDNERDQFKRAKEHAARIAAARLSSWLENVVLPAQSVLVDAPHLVTRLPGLICGELSKASAWNATAVRDPADVVRAVCAKDIEPYRFAQPDWLSRPAWYWPQIAGDKRYVEWAQVERQADVVFCEDTSSFVRRSEAHAFMADVPTQFGLRYVRMPRGRGMRANISYRPLVRLSM